MEAILPFKIKNEQQFIDSAVKVGYNEMEILKFIYVMHQSDLDIFPIMHDERINMLLYGWELCEDYKQKLCPNEWELPEEMETILKLLVPWSMDIWFSKEWDKSKYHLKSALIHCLNRARDLMMRMPDMMQINWDFLLLYNLKPWNVLYLKNLTVTKEKTLENGAQSIEMDELPATDEDVAYVKLEQLPIIVLRLVKLFDQSSIDMVKALCMRVIAAWNKIHQIELETSGSRRPYIPPEDKRCLMLICHIYLMAVYESDDVKGYVIDNMINNIRFYYQGFQNSNAFRVMDNFEYTPARYIALTNFHLRVQKRDFFDFFIWNKYDTSQVNLFGVVSQAYKSYLLGNLLMELNNMNEDDFASNIPLYKRLMNSYVNERERSEEFLLNELTKLEHQGFAHNIIQTVRNITDYESKICKGNRMSNIGNYENSDDTVAPLADTKTKDDSSEIKAEDIKEEIIDEDIELEQKRVKESELRLDPVFQNLPNNESMLYYVYDVLAKKDYKGWHFAKIVLLVKLIGHEQNMVETWRYHPGLTTDFMLNLEEKLSHHYVDLAKIFKNHPFIEQEFWLTAFYLNPTNELYEVIKRLGMRNNRKRTEEQSKLVMSVDNVETKYGLLSSTIDVKELATMSNTDDPNTDYDPLFCALHSLRVPDSLIKDMLTAIFLPRNRSFAWAVDWVVLRNRCKMILYSSKEKKRFVDLNMAEANERLKFLIIDYEKYKNRPQLDYGTIEQGYENLMTREEFDKDSSEEEEDEEEEDFEDDEDVYESKKRPRGRPPASTRKKVEVEQKVEDDNSQEDDPFLMGKRRTRARTAATLASFLFQTLPRSSRRKRNHKSEEETKAEEEKEKEKVSAENDDRSSDSKSPIPTSETPIPSPVTVSCDQNENISASASTKTIKECLKKRPTFLNTTQDFQNVIDIWNVEKPDLQLIDTNCFFLMESSNVLKIAAKLKSLKKEINPIDCDEMEFIDETEMIIHNAEYAIKMECKLEEETDNVDENLVPMEVDNYEEIIESYSNIENVETSIEEPKEAILTLSEETSVVKGTEHIIIETEHSLELTPAEENSRGSINSELSTAAYKDSGEVSETNSKRHSLNIDIEMDEKIKQANDQTENTNLIKEIIEKELEKSREILVETSQDNQETENSLDKNCEKFDKALDNEEIPLKNKEDNESNKGEDCPEYLEEIEVEEEAELEAPAEITEEETTKAAKIDFEIKTNVSHNLDVENKVEEYENQQEDKFEKKIAAKIESLEDNKIEKESELDKEKTFVKESEEDDILAEKEIKMRREIEEASEDLKTTEEHGGTKEDEMKEIYVEKGNMSQETSKVIAMENLESLEDNKELEESKTEKITEATQEEKTNNEHKAKEESKAQEETKETKESETSEELTENKEQEQLKEDKEDKPEKESETNLENTENKQNNSYESITCSALEQETKTNEDENNDMNENNKISNSTEAETVSCDTNTQDFETSTINNKELSNNDVIEESITNLTEIENELSDNKKEIEASNPPLEKEEEKKPELDFKENLEQNITPIHESYKVQELSVENDNAEVDKDSLNNSEMYESNIILHYSSSEEASETGKTINQTEDSPNDIIKLVESEIGEETPDSTNYQKITETLENQTEHEATDINKEEEEDEPGVETKTIISEMTAVAPSEQNDSEKITSTNAEHVTNVQSIPDAVDCKKDENDVNNQVVSESTEEKKYSESPFELLEETSLCSARSAVSTDSETRELKSLCLRKNLKVLLRKLRPSDLTYLRQPKVKVQRMSYEKYLQNFRPKRKHVTEKLYLDFDESSNSGGTNSSSSEAYRPPRLKKIPMRRHSLRQTRTSESENDSNNSEDVKLSAIINQTRKRRLSPPSTSQSSSSQHFTGPKSARKNTGSKSIRKVAGPKSSKVKQKNLIVTPRSASGLKLRISNAKQKRHVAGPMSKKAKLLLSEEIIQLSSTSSDECVWSGLTSIQEVIEIEDNPLFEEEIII